MKTIQLHPLSLLVGLAAGVTGLLLMSQSAVTTFPSARVEVGPHPRDMVQIRQGTPYTVPAGKILTITGLGDIEGHGFPSFFKTQLKINGVNSVAFSSGNTWGGTTIQPVPPGLTARWGDAVELQSFDSNGNQLPGGISIGYLADR